jgi:hypothetical protein
MNVNGWDASTDPLKQRDRLLEIAELGLDDPEVDEILQNIAREAAEFVVEDAREHEIMMDSPLVQIDGLRCYAGIPMVTSRGHVIGSFCVKGTEVRSFSEEDMVVLRKFAKRAVERIEARRPATPRCSQPLTVAGSLSPLRQDGIIVAGRRGTWWLEIRRAGGRPPSCWAAAGCSGRTRSACCARSPRPGSART